MRARVVLGAVALAGLLASTGCGGADPGAGGGADAGPDGRTSAGSPGGGQPAPVALDFSLDTVDGGTFDGATLAGQPAVLWFWAPWCVICAGQASEVSAIAEEYGDRVSVVGVAGLDGSVDAMREFVHRTGVEGLVHLADTEGVVWRRFAITTQSTFVVLDRTGAVVGDVLTDPDQVRQALPRVTS